MQNDEPKSGELPPERDDERVARDKAEELVFCAGYLRWWEDATVEHLLLHYYAYARAVFEFLQTGRTIAEAAALAGASEANIKRARAVGRHSVAWFHEKLTYRSQAGERLTRRHIEALAIATLSEEHAALEQAQGGVGPARKLEKRVRRKNVPRRDVRVEGAPGPLSGEPRLADSSPSRRVSGQPSKAPKNTRP